MGAGIPHGQRIEGTSYCTGCLFAQIGDTERGRPRCVDVGLDLCWPGNSGVVVIVQSQREGRGWRLTCLPSIQSSVPESNERRQDLEERGELEAFCAVGRDLCILLRNGRRDNVFFGKLAWEDH